MNILDLQKIEKKFKEELDRASSGDISSLPFIKHQLSQTPLVAENEKFQVLVVGGTHFMNALLIKTESGIRIEEKKFLSSPRFKTEDDFLSFITGQISSDINILALNLAYPLKPIFTDGKLDGVLISGSKENAFEGLTDKKVGEEIESYYSQKIGKKISVVVANDTICLLLSGLTKYRWDELVGGIVGTGVNFAFFQNELQAVNLEAANFDKFDLSNEGKKLDVTSTHPGKALLEKEVSGAYLYKLFNLKLEAKNLHYPQIDSTSQLEAIIQQDLGEISDIARSIVEKSSQLVSAIIAGIAEFKEQKKLVFVMEGSLFWKGLNYKEAVEQHLQLLISGTNIEFTHIEDSAILGAAKLVS